MGNDFLGYKPPITSLSAAIIPKIASGSKRMSASINIKCVACSLVIILAHKLLRALVTKDSLTMVSKLQFRPIRDAIKVNLIKLVIVGSLTTPP